MRLRHPFEWLTESKLLIMFLMFLSLTLLVMVGLILLGRPLETDIAPYGIVSFELAGNLSAARDITQSWGETGRVYAGLNLGLDYLYIVAYSSCIGLGCVLVARAQSQQNKQFANIGVIIAWGQLVAGLIDAMENYALIQILLGAETNILAVGARVCALLKFVIIAIGVAYVLIGLAMITIAKVHARRAT